MRKTSKYLFFWEGGSIFSQWNSKKEYNKDYQFIDESNIKYSSCEQYMMYHKAKIFKDEKIAKEIMSIKDVKKTKALGRQVKNFDINIWDQHKFNIIVKANYLKFSQNNFFKEELLSYKDLSLGNVSFTQMFLVLLTNIGFATVVLIIFAKLFN